MKKIAKQKLALDVTVIRELNADKLTEVAGATGFLCGPTTYCTATCFCNTTDQCSGPQCSGACGTR
jgi:hypothetical protein